MIQTGISVIFNCSGCGKWEFINLKDGMVRKDLQKFVKEIHYNSWLQCNHNEKRKCNFNPSG